MNRLFRIVIINMLGGLFAVALPSMGAPDGKRKAPNLEDHARYFSTVDTKSGKKAQKADALRLKTISSIQKMLKSKVNATRKFELYLRLGEVFAERGDYLRSVEIRTWTRMYDKWSKGGKKGREPKLTHKISKKELLKSAAAFRKLMRLYPKHPRVDAAIFSLAKTLARLDNSKAETYFLKLIKDYPNSMLMPDAYLALGEYYFDKHNIVKAKQAYKKAIKYKGTKTYPYAVYKLGWAYYNSDAQTDIFYDQNMAKALSAFKLVVRLSDKGRKSQGLDLRKEAINDLVMVWAEIEGVQDAWSYFSKLKEYEAFYNVLEKLGNAYADQGKNDKAIASFTRLLKEAPHRERSPDIYVKLLGLYDQKGNHKHLMRDLKKMHTLYVKGGSVWTRKNKDKLLQADAKETVRKQLHRYSTLYHEKGQKSKRDVFLNTSMRLYQLYLTYYPKDKHAYDIRFYLADIYEHFKMYEKASNSYQIVAVQGKKRKHFKDSSVRMVSTINTLVADKKWPALPEFGQVKKKILIPREKMKLIKVIDLFVKLRPKDKLGYPMAFTAAKTFFDYGHYKDGLARFEKIALSIPKEKQGETALKTILTFHTKRMEWPIVMKKSRMFLGVSEFAKGKMNVVITEHLKNAIFKQGMAYAEAKKHYKAAKMFLAYQKEFPNDADSDEALYNASMNYYKVAEVDKALAVDRQLLKLYPKSKLVPDVNISMARTYEAIADFNNAAKFYLEFTKRFPTDKRSAAALYNSATLFKGLKHYEASTRNYLDFIRKYPSHPKVGEAWYECALMYELTKNYSPAVSSFRQYLAISQDGQDRKLYAQAKIAEISFYHVDRAAGSSEIQRLASLLKSSQVPAIDARRIIAGTMFREITRDAQKFKRSRIRSAGALEQDVRTLQAVLISTAKRFEEVIAVGSGEYVVASLYSLGEMHENFADLLFKAPNPTGADQMTIDQYKSSIEKVAFPLKEEAYKYFQTAYKRSGEIETFSEWTKKAYTKMADLAPESHPEVFESAVKPDYLSLSLNWQDEISDLK